MFLLSISMWIVEMRRSIAMGSKSKGYMRILKETEIMEIAKKI